MIDRLVHDAAPRRVVELAAGLSRRGAALSSTIDYTEIDFPHVIDHKRTLLERTPEGCEVLARLRLVGGDALEVELAPCDLVIAEGLAMYLRGDARRRLFERARAIAPRLVFDLVPADEEPEPGAVGRVLERAMKRFTGGRGFERDARTRTQIIASARAAGFDQIDVIDALAVARAWDLPHAERRTTMVVFSAGRCQLHSRVNAVVGA